MLVYLDSSAILKRVLNEEHAIEFREWLERQSNRSELITSTLAWVEVTRALRRHAAIRGVADLEGRDVEALSGVSACPVSSEVVSLARRIAPDDLRSLDAIHCASAAFVDADLFVSYDDRLLDAARINALPVAIPGRKADQ
ncbi:MAG: type II toxin-antitoxin system VapC family toxin [Actinobacteria bacterium]|nr:type II toxin-antitoxin system VapC family toxin [Actinomycetota bacterium]